MAANSFTASTGHRVLQKAELTTWKNELVRMMVDMVASIHEISVVSESFVLSFKSWVYSLGTPENIKSFYKCVSLKVYMASTCVSNLFVHSFAILPH